PPSAPPAARRRRAGPAWLREHRARLIGAGVVLALLVTIGVAALVRNRAAPAGGSQAAVTAVDVPANQSWTDTGQDVAGGQRLHIQATGDISHFTNGYPVGPDG